MNFLKLLNPWAMTEYPGPEGVGRQQRDAAIAFPEEVRNSRLNYWRPGDPIEAQGRRFLIGVAASFSLSDLRFLDIVNKTLRDTDSSVAVDVFNIEDMYDERREIEAAWPRYFPGGSAGFRTPFVGEWSDGRFVEVSTGQDGMNRVLSAIGSRMIAQQFLSGLSPPAPELMEDYDV